MSECEGQVSLLDASATRGSSRRSDPQTSRDAGRSVADDVLRDQQALVLAAVGTLTDATAWEVTGWINCGAVKPIQQNVVAKRLGELRERGFVWWTGGTRPGSSHREQRVYALTAKGERWRATA